MAKIINDKTANSEPAKVTCLYLSYTPCHFSHNGIDYSLYNNERYELPDIPFIQSLIGQGRLVKQP